MEHGWIPTFLFKSSPVPGSKLKSFFSPPVLTHSVFKVSFLFYTKVHNLFGNILSRIQGERNFYPFLFQIHFYPLLSQQRLQNQHHHALWEKRKTFCSPGSAGSWRVLGLCVIVHRIVPFPLLSLYIVFRDYIVSLREYGQLAFTNICLSTFSF